MAYTVMACTVMACIVMACIVMAALFDSACDVVRSLLLDLAADADAVT